MVVADPRGGNILNFSVGDAVYSLLPRVFWIELQTRFGNQFFVRFVARFFLRIFYRLL